MYPATNTRVRDSARKVIEVSHELREGRAQLTIRVTADGFAVRGDVVESTRANMRWLHESFKRTAVAGVTLEQSLKEPEILEFAALLRRNTAASQKATTFSELWQESFEGLKPVEKIFALAGGMWEHLSGELRAVIEEESPRGERMRELLESGSETFESVEGLVAEAASDADRQEVLGGAVDLLRRVLDVLPPEMLEDPDDCHTIVEKALGQIIGNSALPELRPTGSDLRKVVLEVSGKFFARSDGQEESATATSRDEAPDAPKGHAGDDRFEEDVDEFFADFDTLPDVPVGAVDGKVVAAPVEKLMVCLHRLLTLPRESVLRPVEALLKDSFEAAGSDGDDALRSLIQTLRQLDQSDVDVLARSKWLFSCLERVGIVSRWFELDEMSEDAVVRAFPAGFGTFVRFCAKDEVGLLRIASAAKQIGSDRIEGAASQLFGRGRVLDDACVDAILRTRADAVMPFAMTYLDTVKQPRLDWVARYLGKLNLSGRESAALRVIAGARLPHRYLVDLCRFYAHQKVRSVPLEQMSATLIRRYIEDPGEDSGDGKIIRAVGALKPFWSPKVETFLRDQLRGAGLFRSKRHSRAVRDSIKTFLKAQALKDKSK